MTRPAWSFDVTQAKTHLHKSTSGGATWETLVVRSEVPMFVAVLRDGVNGRLDGFVAVDGMDRSAEELARLVAESGYQPTPGFAKIRHTSCPVWPSHAVGRFFCSGYLDEQDDAMEAFIRNRVPERAIAWLDGQKRPQPDIFDWLQFFSEGDRDARADLVCRLWPDGEGCDLQAAWEAAGADSGPRSDSNAIPADPGGIGEPRAEWIAICLTRLGVARMSAIVAAGAYPDPETDAPRFYDRDGEEVPSAAVIGQLKALVIPHPWMKLDLEGELFFALQNAAVEICEDQAESPGTIAIEVDISLEGIAVTSAHFEPRAAQLDDEDFIILDDEDDIDDEEEGPRP